MIEFLRPQLLAIAFFGSLMILYLVVFVLSESIKSRGKKNNGVVTDDEK